jgi:hypothetical protein
MADGVIRPSERDYFQERWRVFPVPDVAEVEEAFDVQVAAVGTVPAIASVQPLPAHIALLHLHLLQSVKVT